MALKALLLKKQIDNKRKALDALRAKAAEFETREADLAKAIDEVETDEQRNAVQELVDAFEADRQQHDADVAALEQEITGLESDLAAEEAAQDTTPPPADNPVETNPTPAPEERSKNIMNEANVHAPAMSMRDRVAAILNRESENGQVRSYLTTFREAMKNKRAIENVGLTVPEVLLGVLRENVLRYSKLYRHVNVSRVRGEARVLIADNRAEAIWTECCANLNELSIRFYQHSFACYKLGGFMAVCNSSIEDSDIDLVMEIMTALSQSVGYTDDKTIIYGTGVGMPMGIVTRLAQTSKPADYAPTARPWVDLHTSNIKTVADTYTGLALFQQIALAAAAAKGSYSRGEKIWIMNEATYSFIIAQAMNVDATGAIVSSVNGTMPVLGGLIEVLPDSIIPDYNIVMGYFDLYRMVERAGERFASSEHYMFLADMTVFKTTVRWDGLPEIAEAFVLIGINGTQPTTSVTFATDTANEPTSIWLPATATVAAGAKVTLKPVINPYNVSTTLTWDSATTAKATVSASGEVTGVAAGTSVITVTTDNGLSAQCTVTVTSA